MKSRNSMFFPGMCSTTLVVVLCLSMLPSVVNAVTYTDSASQTVSGQDFTFTFSPVELSDGTDGTFKFHVRGDYSVGTSSEYLTWNIDNLVSGNAGPSHGGTVIETYTADDVEWEQTFTISGAVLDTITSDFSITISVDLSSQVDVYGPSFVEVELTYAPKNGHPAAIIVKEYQTRFWNTGTDNENTVAAVGGLTFGGQVSSPSDLAGTDIVIAGQWNSFFQSWIANGGVFIMHDWYHKANQLPGLLSATTASYNSWDINVINSAHPIVIGPFGLINDTLLDGGSASTHGAWLDSSLDPSSDPLAGLLTPVLSSMNSSSVVVFEYSYGPGHIIYANIPLEAYTDSHPLVTPTQPAGLRVYAKNELAFAKSIVKPPCPLKVEPAEGFTSSGDEGGPFEPNYKEYTLTNTGPNSLIWDVNTSVPWLDAEPDTGTLDPGEANSVVVSISINELANDLDPLTCTDSTIYTGTITFSDLTNDCSEIRNATLEVNNVPGEIEVEPNELNFGEVIVGLSQTEQITIANIDTNPRHELCVEDIYLSPAIPEFTLTLPPGGPQWILQEPDNQIIIDVNFTPRAFIDYESTLVIKSDDRDEPEIRLQLSGTGIPEYLEITDVNFVFSGHPGGPFVPTNEYYQLTNNGPISIEWDVSGPDWLDISQYSGTLPPDANTKVTVAPNAQADTEPEGYYCGDVNFTDITTTVKQTRKVCLNVYTEPKIWAEPYSDSHHRKHRWLRS